MSDLVKFLSARYDERERIALATAPSGLRLEWRASHEVNDEGTLVHWILSDPNLSAAAEAFGLERETGGAVAEHIALNDPAQALREVEAGRKILALHKISTEYEPARDENEQFIKVPQLYCEVCGWASDVEGSGCATLRAAVSVYSDHPDYDPAWESG